MATRAEVAKAWERNLLELVGSTDNPDKAGFILRSGRLVDYRGGANGGHYHLAARSAPAPIHVRGEHALRTFLRATGAVRVHPSLESGLFQMAGDAWPSMAQRRQLKSILIGKKDAYVEVGGGGCGRLEPKVPAVMSCVRDNTKYKGVLDGVRRRRRRSR
jgi:hypothetical protein